MFHSVTECREWFVATGMVLLRCSPYPYSIFLFHKYDAHYKGQLGSRVRIEVLDGLLAGETVSITPGSIASQIYSRIKLGSKCRRTYQHTN